MKRCHPLDIPDPSGEYDDPSVLCNQTFSHQIALKPIVNQIPLKSVPYSFVVRESANSNAQWLERYQRPDLRFSSLLKELDDGEILHKRTSAEGESIRFETSDTKGVIALVGKLSESYRKRNNSFGSLKEIDKRKIYLVTANNHPKREIAYTSGYDYITVVGARTAPVDLSASIVARESIKWGKDPGRREITAQSISNKFVESPGNQYRFINSGLRQLMQFPAASVYDHGIQRIMVVFQYGYTENDIERINEYAKKMNGRVVYVRNTGELVRFLNQRKSKQRLIKQLVIYAHGIIEDEASITSFHYAAEKAVVENGLFGASDVEKIYESIFDHDAVVISYACRSGISKKGHNLMGQDPGRETSLAQKMADSWDVKVQAFEMRTNYAKIYGSGTEITEARNYGAAIKKYEKALGHYDIEIAAGNNLASPPVKPDNYDRNVIRKKDLEAREKNGDTSVREEDKGGPIAPNGAWYLPETGETPMGLQKGLQIYLPKEWKIL